MRLCDYEVSAIKQSAHEILGEEVKVYLFGSRMFDDKKGGDIDLLMEVPHGVGDLVRKKLQIVSKIQRLVGEQKIDLIITHFQEFSKGNVPLIIRKARKEGIIL